MQPEPIVASHLQYKGIDIEAVNVDERLVYVVRRVGGVFPYTFDTLAGAHEFIDGWEALQSMYRFTPLGDLVAAPEKGS